MKDQNYVEALKNEIYGSPMALAIAEAFKEDRPMSPVRFPTKLPLDDSDLEAGCTQSGPTEEHSLTLAPLGICAPTR